MQRKGQLHQNSRRRCPPGRLIQHVCGIEAGYALFLIKKEERAQHLQRRDVGPGLVFRKAYGKRVFCV